MIDGVDISKIDLTTLRNEINVVLQQHFVISSDSIKDNLDPKKTFSEREIYNALSESAFFNTFEAQNDGVNPEETMSVDS